MLMVFTRKDGIFMGELLVSGRVVFGGYVYPKNPFVCPKKGIGPPTFLFYSDGIGTRKILFDRDGSGFLGDMMNFRVAREFVVRDL